MNDDKCIKIMNEVKEICKQLYPQYEYSFTAKVSNNACCVKIKTPSSNEMSAKEEKEMMDNINNEFNKRGHRQWHVALISEFDIKKHYDLIRCGVEWSGHIFAGIGMRRQVIEALEGANIIIPSSIDSIIKSVLKDVVKNSD